MTVGQPLDITVCGPSIGHDCGPNTRHYCMWAYHSTQHFGLVTNQQITKLTELAVPAAEAGAHEGHAGAVLRREQRVTGDVDGAAGVGWVRTVVVYRPSFTARYMLHFTILVYHW